jgi:hypothetical protein
MGNDFKKRGGAVEDGLVSHLLRKHPHQGPLVGDTFDPMQVRFPTIMHLEELFHLLTRVYTLS